MLPLLWINTLNAAPEERTTDGVSYTFGHPAYASDPDFSMGFGPSIAKSDGGALLDSEAAFLEYGRTAYHFDDQPERPTLFFEHSAVNAPDLAYDVCEYHGERPAWVQGKDPKMKNSFGDKFHPVMFRPSSFYTVQSRTTNGGGSEQFAQHINSMCVSWVTECPVRVCALLFLHSAAVHPWPTSGFSCRADTNVRVHDRWALTSPPSGVRSRAA